MTPRPARACNIQPEGSYTTTDARYRSERPRLHSSRTRVGGRQLNRNCKLGNRAAAPGRRGQRIYCGADLSRVDPGNEFARRRAFVRLPRPDVKLASVNSHSRACIYFTTLSGGAAASAPQSSRDSPSAIEASSPLASRRVVSGAMPAFRAMMRPAASQ